MVIYGGRIHAGKIDGYKQFVRKLTDKAKLTFCATGAILADGKETIKMKWGDKFII